MQSSALVIVVECPPPVVSSTINTLPAGNLRTSPSPAVTWYSPPQRNFSADIAAALDHGPTSSQPGILAREEPIGAIPWRSHDRGPNGP